MKVKIAVEFLTEIDENNWSMKNLIEKIISSVESEHNDIISTGESCFIAESDGEREFDKGVFYYE